MPSFLISTTIAFFSTTIDDFAIMLYFFALAENEKTPAAKRLQYAKVVAGQTIGFSIVILVSLIGFVLGLLIPEDYIDLIGFIPIIAGFMKLHEVMDEEGYLENCPAWCRASSDGDKDAPKSADAGAKYSGLPQTEDALEAGSVIVSKTPEGSYNNPAVVAPNVMYREGADEGGAEDDNEPPADTSEGNCLSKAFSSVCQSCLDPFTREVTVMALICSSDNVAIYIAIFATEKKWEVFLTVIVFYLLLALNIVAAIALMKVRCR
jgi:cadmium resistance protein CadD (predicted permease)